MIRSIMTALSVGLLASSASAQGMRGQNQPPDQWVMNCNTERGRDCTVSAMIDGGQDNLLGTFLIVSYSVAYGTLTVVADGLGQRASIQVDQWPLVSTTLCTGGECSYEQGRSNDLLQAMLRGSKLTVQISTSDDGMVGPLTNTLSGFAAQYQRAVEAQRR